MPQSANERPFTEIHHNNKSLILCFLDDDQKAKECWQCQIEFPRRQKIILCDVGLPHEEKWAYPDPKQPGHKLPSTKYYCIKGSCIKIKTRYPCYDLSLLHIPPDANSRLQGSHFDLLSQELDFETQHRSCWRCLACCKKKVSLLMFAAEYFASPAWIWLLGIKPKSTKTESGPFPWCYLHW